MLFALVLAAWSSLPWAMAMRADQMAQLRRKTVDMFYHGYDNYMQHAFPEDEVRQGPVMPSDSGDVADLFGPSATASDVRPAHA